MVTATMAVDEKIPEAFDVRASSNSFNLRLLQRTDDAKENLIISSYSIMQTLGLLLVGLRGKSEAEMMTFLEASGSESVTVTDSLGRLIKELESAKVELVSANSAFVDQSYDILPSYIAAVQKHFDSAIKSVDFRNNGAAAVKEMNDFVSEATRSLIPKMFDGPLDVSTRLVLLNAVYFKGAWKKKFDVSNTEDRNFRMFQSGAWVDRSVKTMFVKTSMRTYEASEKSLRLAELPYEGDSKMYILVPTDERHVTDVMKHMSVADLEQLFNSVSKAYSRQTNLYLPKFSIESSLQLKPVLQAMGVSTIFTPEANVSGITETNDLLVSAILHKAKVDVDEEGTVAAAATGIVMALSSAPMRPQEFRVDRPFAFFIDVGGLHVFSGIVHKLPFTHKTTEQSISRVTE